MKKTLLVRIDRLGDLVLTLPMETSFEGLQNSHWWIPKGLGFVAQSAVPAPNFSEVAKDFSLKNFLALLKELKRERYDQALIFYAPAWVYLLIFLAGIPIRAGRYSQWYSFLFLNRGLRQKRSLSEKSELLYNFELVRDTLKLTPRESSPGPLELRASREQEKVLRQYQLTPQNYAVVHPGMGGSALNWPAENYRKLIQTLLDSGREIALTGTKTDRPFTDPLKDLSHHPRMHWLAEKLSGSELIDVLASASWTLAPSTGVVHLSASLGTLTYGIYSPLLAESATRWGPQGKRVHVLTLDEQKKLTCPEKGCSHPPCLVQAKFESESLL